MRCAIFGITDAWQWNFLQITRSLLDLFNFYPPRNGDSWFPLGKFVLFVLSLGSASLCLIHSHFQFSLSLSAHHSLKSLLVFACSMSRATLYSQYLCHVSASMIRLVCSIALVRVAKAGSLSYFFPSRVHRGAQEPAVETGSIVHPLYSTTLENPFVASFILPPNR
jgi:hypothetical protein